MEKKYLLKGLDCPNCSAKIEKEVAGLDGVRLSAVNLMKQTITVDIEESYAAAVERGLMEIVNRYEPEVEVSELGVKNTLADADKDEKNEIKATVIRFALGAVLFIAGIVSGHLVETSFPLDLIFLIISYIILGADVVAGAIKNIIKGHFLDENFLMTVSSMGAFFIGEQTEAVAVMLFYQVGEFFQDLSVRRSRKSISDLMNIRPDSATVLRNGQLITVSPEEVSVGEIITVKTGEKIPLDGRVIEGQSLLDTAALTGESVPRNVGKDDSVLSGCINQSGLLKIEVTKPYGESTVSKIIDLVENASNRKATSENFITAFARRYTPIVVIFAVLLMFAAPLIFGGVWSEWIRRGLIFLVISCPCALVISIPLTFFGGIGAASKHGILVKGGNYLEALSNVGTVVFDKTGTLTKGVFKVTDICPANGFSAEQILECAATVETFSNHPIAKSVLMAFGRETDRDAVNCFEEISGHGVSAFINGKQVLAGNAALMASRNISYVPCESIGTKVYVAIDGVYAGCILIADEIKEDSKKAIEELKRVGIEKTVMLTGDSEEIGKAVARELNIDEYTAQLLPEQKVEELERLSLQNRNGKKLVFVGDGINDAPVLARADVGVAMGGLGSDAAIEAADVVLMTDEPSRLADAVRIAGATRRIVIQNIVISLSIKGIFLLLGAFGIAGMWEAVFGDVGVALIAVFNAMRIMKK